MIPALSWMAIESGVGSRRKLRQERNAEISDTFPAIRALDFRFSNDPPCVSFSRGFSVPKSEQLIPRAKQIARAVRWHSVFQTTADQSLKTHLHDVARALQ